MKKQISYHYRLYLGVSAVIFMLMIVVGIFFYQHDAKLLRESVENNTIESLTTIHTRLDDRLRAMDGVAKKIQVSEEFLGIVSSMKEGTENYFQEYPRMKEKINQLLIQNLVSEELGTSVHFISRYLDFIGVYMRVDPYNRIQVTKEKLQEFRIVEDYLQMKEYVSYIPPHKNEWIMGKQLAFSVIRPVRDTFESFGILEITQTMREMDDLLFLREFADSYEIYILDELGNVTYAYGSDHEVDMEKIPKEITDLSTDFQYIEKDFLVCSHKSQLTGWTLVMSRSLDGFYRQIQAFQNLFLSVLLIVFLTVMVFLFVLTKSLTRPLRELKSKLYNLRMDEEIHLDIHAESNEVTALAVGIEEFLNQIRTQNRLMIEIRKRALKAHLDRMEAQMSPHFLYNALAVMGACGQEDGSERVYHMSRGLADLLRYSIKYDHNLVEFQDEIQNVKNYLLIMGLRYEEQVEVTWNLEDSLNCVKVPKLSFQPVLENCFKHGFKSRKKIWKIEVQSMKIENQWRFVVRNNGEPFEKEKIQSIKERYKGFVEDFSKGHENQEKNEPAGLGLENTLKRLFIQYGEKSFWDIRIEEEWTVVEIGGVIVE